MEVKEHVWRMRRALDGKRLGSPGPQEALCRWNFVFMRRYEEFLRELRIWMTFFGAFSHGVKINCTVHEFLSYLWLDSLQVRNS